MPGWFILVCVSVTTVGTPNRGYGEPPLKLRELRELDESVLALAFSPDGTRLASAGDRTATIKVWNVATGELAQTLTGSGREVHALEFAPDGRRLVAAAWDGKVYRWNLVTGRSRTFSLAEDKEQAVGFAFSRDCHWLAVGGLFGSIRIVDVIAGVESYRLHGHGILVNRLAFSPDGKTLASSSWDGTVRVWDVDRRRERYALRNQSIEEQGEVALAFSPDGKSLATGFWDLPRFQSEIRIWETATGKRRETLKSHKLAVRSVVFSPDGRLLASSSWGGQIKLWDVDMLRARSTFQGPGGPAQRPVVVFAPDGKSLAWADESDCGEPMITIWRLPAFYLQPRPDTVGPKRTH